MKPKPSTIQNLISEYGKMREFHNDPFVARFAQAMETALRWATENTHGWEMHKEPEAMARCLKIDLRMSTEVQSKGKE